MTYGDRVLFQGVTLHFSSRRRYGLVGANGAGKTTFLKIVSGKKEASRGTVQIPKDARVGMLDQDYFCFEKEPIRDLVIRGDQKLWQALKRKEALLNKERLTPEETEEISEIEAQLVLKEGYRAEARAAQLLSGLGIDVDRQEKPLDTLSGGYQLRVLLAQVLFVEPEILLLDEPTNYLDLFSIRFLERYLLDYPGTVILSSHDRFFLNQVCQEILDIDYGGIRRYVGNFDHFLQQKEIETKAKETELEALAKRKKEIGRFISRFKAKASKARQAGSREKMIEKLEKEEKACQILPSSRQYPHFQLSYSRPSGQRTLVVKDLSKSFGKHSVLKEVSFEIERLEKVAIVGPNGMGKSTLVEILTEHLPLDKGSFRWGPHVHWKYFPQNFHRLLGEEMTVYDWMSGVSKEIPEQKLRQTLGQMLFDEHSLRKKVKNLSGGEGARLVFAHLMVSEQNVLILDEPTNHLDMESVEALIQALKNYQGTLVLVSHNRYFISEIADRILELRPDGFVDFRGGYEEFVEQHERDYLSQALPKGEHKEKKNAERKEERKERNRLKREIESLEKEIESFDQKIQNIHLQLAAPDFYKNTPPEKLQTLISQKDMLEKKRDEGWNLWEDLMNQLDTQFSK
ncbi:MAG: ABC-F family ATP-binding cassette domain-containing protein [Chlamydiia bacterium]|nr:ABC-F family ATP-binding cassette domain-containing protein [Chlamydiia bacterium]